MKSDKNKKIVLASTIVLGIAAITSSALAAYIITGGNNKGTETVDPADVKIENRVTSLKVAFKDNDNTLNFTSETGTGTTVYDDGKSGEPDFTVTLTLTMTAQDKTYIPDLSITVGDGGSGSTDYVALPSAMTITDDNASPAWSGTVPTFTMDITLTWDWSVSFAGGPTVYYSTGAGAQSDSSTILEEMETFRDTINATTYTITITDQVA